MKCPACLSPHTKVIDSREYKNGEVVRRRRQCQICLHRFTTYEYVEKPQIRVLKKNGVSESFKPEKIRKGIVLACEKLDIGATAIDEAVDRIERRIRALYTHEVSTEEIGNVVMAELRALNHVAYVRFAAVYREFKDINTFLAELESLRKSVGEENEELERHSAYLPGSQTMTGMDASGNEKEAEKEKKK